MKRSKILALLLAVLLVVGTFAACGESSNSSSAASTASKADASSAANDTSTPAEEESSEPAADNTNTSSTGDHVLNMNAAMEPTSLNTITSTYSIEFSMHKHLFENLYMLDDNDEPQPAAAETVDISEDQKVYTFHLRDDGKWTNGEPVTAKDFEFAWQQVLNPDNAADYAYFLYDTLGIVNAKEFYEGSASWEDVGVKVIDDLTLEVTLKNPIPYAPFLFTFGTLAPINEKFYTEVGADMYATEAENFCTNGAFKVTEWKHDSQIVMEKNADFHRASEIEVDKINWKIITDPQAAFTEFMSGGLDVVGLSTGELITQAENQDIEVLSYADGSAFYIYFNHSHEYLKNANLRKALALGFDKEGMVNSVYQNGNQPMTSFTCPEVKGSDGKSFAESLNTWNGGELTPKNGDVEAAKGYLETALQELGCTVEDLSASLSIDCGDSSNAINEAAFYQEQWRQNLGIEVTVNSMQTKQGSENRKNGNYVMSLTGWGPDYNDPMTFLDLWVSTGGNNQTFYASEAYDKLIADAAVETDLEKRQEMFYEVEKLIVEDLPVAPSYWRFPSYAVNNDKIASGVHRSTFQDINVVNVKFN